MRPDLRITEYIQRIKQERPPTLRLVGVGRDVGRAAWLALVLERDHRFLRTGLDLDRVPGPNGLDVGRITIALRRPDGSDHPAFMNALKKVV